MSFNCFISCSFFDDFSLNLPGIFSSFFGDSVFSLGERQLERCEKCGSCFDDIIKTGTVGCADCYEKFYNKLLPSIQRIHGKAKHSGKIPPMHEEEIKIKEKTPEEKIAELEAEMQKAVAEQNFERAAIIRDEIKKMKGEN